MQVKLVGYTMPAPGAFDDQPDSLETVQDIISYCARVSNPSNQFNTMTSEKLLNYLATHSHWSPFEMVSATLEITTTRDIARQILRHRSFSFQEFSQRYADPTESMNFVLREARYQDEKNRQNSVVLGDSKEESMIRAEWKFRQNQLASMAKEHYKWALSKGLAKEVARGVLPEGMTESRLYMAGTIRSWIHYVNLRSGNGTQKEHKEIAIAAGQEVAKIVPVITKFYAESAKIA